MQRRIENIGKKPALYSAIFQHILHPQIHFFPIYVGTRKAITRLAREERPIMNNRRRKDEQYSRLLHPDSLSKLPREMGLGLERFYNVNEMHHPSQMARVGDIRITIIRKDGQVIAIPVHYYPKNEMPMGYFGGIRAANYEAKIMEHLKRTEGVTHVDQMGGYAVPTEKELLKETTKYRRMQAKAYNLDLLKRLPVDEWIAKLKSIPDYSKIKK